MKYTETIEELEDLIKEYEGNLDSGYIGDTSLSYEDIEWRKKAITNMACAINALKDLE